MKRRDFITLVGSAAAWPLAARAQQTAKLPTIGFMGASTPSAWSRWVAAFEQQLRTRGWMDGRTVAIEYRWAQGRPERFARSAARNHCQRYDFANATIAASRGSGVFQHRCLQTSC